MFYDLFYSMRLIRKTPSLLLLSMAPFVIGVILYLFLGQWIFLSLLPWGKGWFLSHFLSGMVASIFYYFVAFIVSILFFLLVNWTFVLIVSVISSPFLSLLSEKVERIVESSKRDVPKQSFVALLIQESKKLFFLGILSLFAFFLGLLPFMTPLALLLSAICIAVNFFDYSFSRHLMSYAQCVRFYRTNFIKNSFWGLVFMVLLGVPLLNLFVLSWATSFFTILFIKNRGGCGNN